MGFTLNSLTLLALTLSVGIVIDDAIVVMENIFRFIEEKGFPPYQAAIAATGEIALAVMAITISLVAVFLPIAMMEGIIGRFLKSFGITMAATIMVSMLVSFTLTPMMASRWFKKPKKKNSPCSSGDGQEGRASGDKHGVSAQDALPLSQRKRGPSESSGGSKGQVFYHAIESVYLVMLRFSLRNRWIVVLATVGCLATLPVLFKILPKCFTPDEDSSEFQISVQATEGTSLEATGVLVKRIAREVRATIPNAVYTVSSVADTDQRNPYQGTVYVRLVNIANRKEGQLDIMDAVRKNVLPKYVVAERLRVSVTPVSFMSGGGMSAASVQYMIGGPDITKLEQYAKTVMAEVRTSPAPSMSIPRFPPASRNTASASIATRPRSSAFRFPTSPTPCSFWSPAKKSPTTPIKASNTKFTSGRWPTRAIASKN
jgi:hydrophobic/amphiphilic exporter-1 (mainly G- bacteria), HAE1 family